MPTYNNLVTQFSFEGSTAPLVNFNQLTETMTASLAQSHQALADLAASLSSANDDFNEAANNADDFSDEVDRLGDSAQNASNDVGVIDETTLGFQTTLAATAAILTTVVAGMTGWTSSISLGIDPLVQMSRVTGESLEDLQAWGYAASQNGSDVDAVAESMREMNLRMGEFARSGGGPAAEAFEQFGISIKNANGEIISASDLMLKLNKEMQHLSEGERLDLLDKVGADQSLVQLLGASGDQIDSLRKKALALGVVTQEQGDKFAAYNDSVTTAQYGIESLSRTMAIGMLPAVDSLTNAFVDFLIENQKFLSGVASGIGNFFSGLIESLDRMAPVLAVATAAMTAYWFATGGAATAMAILTAPLTAIIAGATALYLVIDDLIVALEGGESVIRSFFLDNFDFDIVPMLEEIIETVKSLFNYMMGIAEPLLDVFKNVFSLIFSIFTLDGEAAAESLLNIFSGLGDYIYNVFVKLPSDIFGLFSTEGESFFDGFLSFAKVTLDKFGKFYTDLFSGLFGAVSEKASTAISSAVDLVKSLLIKFKNWIVSFFDFDLFGGIADGASAVIDKVTSIGSSIGENVSGAFDSVKNAASGVADSVGGFFTGLFDSNDEEVGFIESAKSSVSSFFDSSMGTFKDLFTNVTGLGDEAFKTMKNAASTVFFAPLKTVESLFDGTFGDIAGDALKMMTSITGGVVDGARGLTDQIFGFFDDMFGGVVDNALSMFWGLFDKLKGMLFDIIPDFLMPENMEKKINSIEQARMKNEAQTFNQPSYNSSQSTHQENQINVYTSDPVEAGNQVSSQLNEQLKSARLASARGGM